MILPGETEAGSAGMQPRRGIAWWVDAKFLFLDRIAFYHAGRMQ
jgi:hypothetical protein